MLRLSDYICKDDVCYVEVNNEPIYRDSIGHLTIDGSKELGLHHDIMGDIIQLADGYWDNNE